MWHTLVVRFEQQSYAHSIEPAHGDIHRKHFCRLAREPEYGKIRRGTTNKKLQEGGGASSGRGRRSFFAHECSRMSCKLQAARPMQKYLSSISARSRRHGDILRMQANATDSTFNPYHVSYLVRRAQVFLNDLELGAVYW